MMLRFCIALLCGLLAGSVSAGTSRADVRKTIESSLLVTGSVDIGGDGAVIAHRVDHPEMLPQAVRDLVARTVPKFRFEPPVVDGRPVAKGRAKMGLRVVATPHENGDFRIRLANASFGAQAEPDSKDKLLPHKMTPPVYPAVAYQMNVSGTVYLVLKIGGEGKVEDVAVEQTNLTVLGNERQMRRSRAMLETTSTAAARRWEFDTTVWNAPESGGFWSVRVPVAFTLRDSMDREPSATPYGRWEAYVPGPKHRVSWLSDEENRRSPDAMVAGVAQPVGSGPKLLTRLGEG